MKKIVLALTLIMSFLGLHAQEHFYDFIYYGESSNPTNFYKAGNIAYFTATNENGNLCLYKTDGSKTGTEMVYEFTDGEIYLKNYTQFNKYVFFTASTPKGTQIWHTQGTKETTKLFHESASFHGNREIGLFVFNDHIFYQDQFSQDSFYIKAVDTTLTKNTIIARHKHGYQYSKGNFVSTANYMFYSYNDKLYRIDQSLNSTLYWERSTSLAGDIPYLYSSNNVVIWYMRVSSSSKTQVYAVKETGANVQEIELLYGYPYIYDHLSNGNFFYYAIGEYNGYPKLYRLNTKNFNSTEIGYCFTRDRKIDLEVFDGQVYYANFTNGDSELYKVGNLSSSPTKVKDIANDTSSSPQSFISYDNKLYFSAFERKSGRELYVSEGAASNTKLAFDFNKGPMSSLLGINSIEINGKLLMSGTTMREGNEIWVSDGSESGTELLMNVNPKVDRGNQQVSSFMPVGDYLYLFANDSINGAELWRTDGSEEGTIFLDNINIANFPSAMEEYIEFKGNLYGTAVSFFEGIELYTSNGTPQGSKFVTPSDLFSSSFPHNYVVDGNYFYYIGSTGLFGGLAIFRSDGTKAGTKPYLATGNDINGVSNLTRVGDRFYASIDDDTYGKEPYEVDLENGKLTLIHNFVANSQSSNPKFFCGTTDTIFFIAESSPGKYDVVYTSHDFSFIAGQKIYSIGPGLKNAPPDTLFRTENCFFMIVKNKNNVDRLINHRNRRGWAGLNPKDEYNNIQELTSIGDKVIFSAAHPTFGQELFITNGTDSGTFLLKDINPGSASSNPDNFYVFNDQLIFTASTASHGSEVWITDGTSAGTKLLWDIQKGSGSSYPTEYAAYKGYLYISASDSIREKSLYRFVIDSCDIINPIIASNKNNFVVCEGETIDLYAETGLEVEKLTWFKNGNPIITAGDTFTTNEVGKYKFTVSQGSCNISSPEIEIEAAPAVSFSIAYESDSGFCEGGLLNLIASGDDDLSVKWFRDGEEYSSLIKTTTFVAGDFFAIGRNQFGCRDTSRTLTVEVYENPKPKVNLINDTLWSTVTGAHYTYQWFFKGGEKPGETNEFVAPKENGAYKVEVSNDKGCSGESNGFKYEGNSIDDFISAFNIGAYPNPFFHLTKITYKLESEQDVIIEVYNLTGKKVSTLVNDKQAAGGYIINFNSASSENYLLRISIGQKTGHLKLFNLATGL